MAQHRLNDPAILPATRVLINPAPRTGRGGQHRVATSGVIPTVATTGAFVAAAGVIGLTVGGAATQASADTPPAPISAPGIPSLPALALPALPTLPSDLALPAPLDELARDLLPANPIAPIKTSAPTTGTVTSGYGARWGTTHYGLDIANDIGTPVYAVTDGTVLESGPASGFGQWIRVQQDDGTIGVFGHVDESYVSAGQQVRAGEQIGTVGNEGESTGPHLHYEVWDTDGSKIDPEVWLNNRGVSVE
ncbi:M23 family metallopeptidase [Nocardia sp. 348MFTsu5.1]|uniref:M23 family metallopeptidase n=1 Tax=Nocardia sp. 348MFTsu5.1 TaxID=1172185 RepID=UPI0003759815|nr:M23 family metallopeptidase [Nocardia sp. 348MFTsu5.1]